MLSGVDDAELDSRSGAPATARCGTSSASLADGRLRADAAVLAGPQHVAGIREQRADADRAHLRIDLAIDGEHVPRCGYVLPSASTSVEPAARLPQLARPMRASLTWPAMPRYSCSLSGKYALIGSSCDTVVSSVVGPTRSPICARGDRRDAVDERGDAREAEVQLRGLDRRLGRRDRRLRRVVRADVVVQLTLRDGALLGQRPVAREIALGLARAAPALSASRACAWASAASNGPAIDFEQHLALPDEGAFPIRCG